MAFAPDVEVTLEANPGTVEHGRFAGYRDAGINRVSLGAQTFDAEQLRTLGRIHGSGDIARAVEEVRSAGIDNFNLDLMYGLPAQTLQQAMTDLDAALSLEPTHISHYQLTLEPGTVFYHRPPPLPESDAIWQMQLDCQEQLAARGYEHYEVSAYARCRTAQPAQPQLLAVRRLHRCGRRSAREVDVARERGASAVAIVRSARIKQPREFLRRAAADRVSDRFQVATEDLPFEYMLNVLRLTDDFGEDDFEARTGVAFARSRRRSRKRSARASCNRQGPGDGE